MTPESGENALHEHLSGWVNAPNKRGTQDILWNCFFTIFVCTWTVLHLNLPSSKDSGWIIMRRKAKWMTAAIIVPELVTATAFAQRVESRHSVKAMELIGCPWTLTHAFYANMGGVWLQPRQSQAFPINAAQLNYLIAERVIKCPDLTKKEIWDRSKADKFAKILACMQILWLFMQCVVRASVDLPVTPLEIATLGFAIPSIATFSLWFDKPQDIETPTFFPIEMTTAELLEKIGPRQYDWLETPLDFIDKVNSPSFTSEMILKASWWPGRDAYTGPAHRIRNDGFALKYSKIDQLFVVAVWIGYAGTHFSAWNFSFPSYAEMFAWRICCIGLTASMLVFWITSNRKVYLLVAYLVPWKRKQLEKVSCERQKVSAVQIVSGVVTASSYLVARLGLIVLSLMSLQSLPAGAFRTVNWTEVFPVVQ